MLDPPTGNAGEGVLRCNSGCRLHNLLLFHRIHPLREKRPLLRVALPGTGERHVRVLPEGHKLLLAVKAISPAPHFPPDGVTQRYRFPPSAILGFVCTLRPFDFRYLLAPHRPPSILQRMYHQVKIDVPPHVPSADAASTEPSWMLNAEKPSFCWAFGQNLDSNGNLWKGDGGEWGIRTPGTAFAVQRFSKPSPSATRPTLQRVVRIGTSSL